MKLSPLSDSASAMIIAPLASGEIMIASAARPRTTENLLENDPRKMPLLYLLYFVENFHNPRVTDNILAGARLVEDQQPERLPELCLATEVCKSAT